MPFDAEQQLPEGSEPEFSAPGPHVANVGGTLNLEDLLDFVRTNLGEGVWEVELTEGQFETAVKTAIRKYGRRMPFYRYGHITAVENRSKYTFPPEIDVGFGIARVEFVRPLFFGSAAFVNKRLLGVTTIGSYRLDDYDIFARWRMTFERVTSTLPSWKWEEDTKTLWVYNPISNTRISYMAMVPPKKLEEVRLNDEDWMYDYVLARCKLMLGENRGKFSGTIPGPRKDLALNAEKLTLAAQTKIDELEKQLLSMQRRVPPEFF